MKWELDNRTCFGQEIEYRCRLTRGGTPVPATLLIPLVPRIVPVLPDGQHNGWFVPCGGRCYYDPSGHIEWATPEVTSPLDAIRYIHAGHQLMTRLAEMYRGENPQSIATISRHNMDYRKDCSWACHTSFLTRSRSCEVVVEMTSFLVTKMIFDGAGGFNVRSGTRRFSLAPRLEMHRRITGGDTQHHRALICTREERPGLIGRQHLTCNETLCSQLAEYLRFGASALVFKLLDARVLRGVQLAEPIAALHTFAADPACAFRMPLTDGRMFSAVEIQRHYLDQVETNLGQSFMPPWAAEVCHRWRRLLDLLAGGAPESVVGRLDWATKWSLFEAIGGERWNEDALFEIDARFGELRTGLWDEMDRDGLLKHRLLAEEEFAAVLDTPPEDTRARPRGKSVVEMQRAPKAVRDSCVSSWEAVRDGKRGRYLDLTQPFQTDVEWRVLAQ